MSPPSSMRRDDSPFPKNRLGWVRHTIMLSALLSVMTAFAADVRVFTDNQGRIFRGELQAVNGQLVTIKREADGQTFTLKASNFSPVDMAYFKEHGLKDEAPAPPPGGGASGAAPKASGPAPGTPATDAPLRVSVKVYPKTTDRPLGRSFYTKIQKTTYKIEVHNDEYKRELGKTRATVLTFGKVLNTPDVTQVMGREDFDLDAIRAAGTLTHEVDKIVETEYDNETSWGVRYSGYLFVMKDGSGAIMSVSASSESLAKHAEDLLKLKPQNLFDHSYKKSGEGTKHIMSN